MAYSTQIRAKAKDLYESEGLSYREISRRLGIPNYASVMQWSQSESWEKGKNASVLAHFELEARWRKAEELGVGLVDQMVKACELMDAAWIAIPGEGSSKPTLLPMPPGLVLKPGKGYPTANFLGQDFPVVPNYQAQNEGLKRAMELIGIKSVPAAPPPHGETSNITVIQLPEKTSG